MSWTLTVRGLNASEGVVDEAVENVVDLLEGQGLGGFTFALQHAEDDLARRVQRTRPVGTCPDCGGDEGLHALLCPRYTRASGQAGLLPEFGLAELRWLVPYDGRAGFPDRHDQAMPVVEIPQEYLAALLAEVEAVRRSAHRDEPDKAQAFAAHNETSRDSPIQFAPPFTPEQRRILRRVADVLLSDEGLQP
jgi:hypothetical protein